MQIPIHTSDTPCIPLMRSIARLEDIVHSWRANVAQYIALIRLCQILDMPIDESKVQLVDTVKWVKCAVIANLPQYV